MTQNKTTDRLAKMLARALLDNEEELESTLASMLDAIPEHEEEILEEINVVTARLRNLRAAIAKHAPPKCEISFRTQCRHDACQVAGALENLGFDFTITATIPGESQNTYRHYDKIDDVCWGDE